MARLTAQQKLNLSRKSNLELQERILEMADQTSAADDRAKNADLEAADAIRKYNSAEQHIGSLTNELQNAKLELATLRGYTQRVNQTDNAHHMPDERTHDSGLTTVHPKFGLPEVRHECPPENAGCAVTSDYYRNR